MCCKNEHWMFLSINYKNIYYVNWLIGSEAVLTSCINSDKDL